MKCRKVKIGKAVFGGGKLAMIAGPCVIESRAICLRIARRLAAFAAEENAPLIFKASYDKANRSSVSGFRGPGIDKGLDILREIRETTGLPLLTDVHTVAEVEKAAAVVDVIQIPAFLCRQTDLLLAAGNSGKPVNIKKGQFMAAPDMEYALKKVESTGNQDIMLTERGNSFGYNNLVVDMRNLLIMRQWGYPVIFDATHSVQRPGAGAGCSGGDGHWAPALARAAVATGVDGVFVETHISPQKALSDSANMIPLRILPGFWRQLSVIHAATVG